MHKDLDWGLAYIESVISVCYYYFHKMQQRKFKSTAWCHSASEHQSEAPTQVLLTESQLWCLEGHQYLKSDTVPDVGLIV